LAAGCVRIAWFCAKQKMALPVFVESIECIDMGHSYVQIQIHLVWATMDRLPLIDAEARSKIHMAIADEARRLSTQVVAIGGVSDHMHLLVSLPPTMSISYIVKQLKGVSSLECGPAFRWQPGYAALSVSRRDVRRVADYIENQETHHSSEILIASLERTA
jgi:REP element-mobilizing transposase RayT